MGRYRASFIGKNVFLTKSTAYSYEVRMFERNLLITTITANRADCIRIAQQIDEVDFSDLPKAIAEIKAITQASIKRGVSFMGCV